MENMAQCDYCKCGVPLEELKTVQLRYYENKDGSTKIGWSSPISICNHCRFYLRGVFRFHNNKGGIVE